MVERAIEWYFEQNYPRHGRFDLPLLRREKVELDDLGLIRFSNIIRNETADLGATVHFFEDDERFDEVWKNPESYVDEVGQYRQTLSPDFSLYTNMPMAQQVLNTFRSRWCGWYWQERGLMVIPTVSWSTTQSYSFCFDGLPLDAVLAVSTVGVRYAEELFMAGYERMCSRLHPSQVICYGEPFAAMAGLAPVIEVPYVRDRRVAPRKP
jgi:hypothetical protein